MNTTPHDGPSDTTASYPSHGPHSSSTIPSRSRNEPAREGSIVWNSVLHLTTSTPPDAGFSCVAAAAHSAELQLASATKSESYIGTHTAHYSRLLLEMETVSIATFPSSVQHSSRSRSTEGVGVQNNKLFFSPSNIIATIMQGGMSSALSYKCLLEY